MTQDYKADRDILCEGPIEDGYLEFERVRSRGSTSRAA